MNEMMFSFFNEKRRLIAEVLETDKVLPMIQLLEPAIVDWGAYRIYEKQEALDFGRTPRATEEYLHWKLGDLLEYLIKEITEAERLKKEREDRALLIERFRAEVKEAWDE